MIKELSSLAPKLGAGFSRILSKLDGPEILDMLNGSSANKTSATDEPDNSECECLRDRVRRRANRCQLQPCQLEQIGWSSAE